MSDQSLKSPRGSPAQSFLAQTFTVLVHVLRQGIFKLYIKILICGHFLVTLRPKVKAGRLFGKASCYAL